MPNLQDVVIIDIPSGNCAVCQNADGLVVNTIVAEPTDPTPRPGFYLVGIELNTPVSIGCRWNGTQFLDAQGNVLVPDVPEVRCAMVNENSFVDNFALAQINQPFVYQNYTLIPLVYPSEEPIIEPIVGIGFYWDGTNFVLPQTNISAVLQIEKSNKTAEFLNKIIQGDKNNNNPIPYGFVNKIILGDDFDKLEVVNVLNTFEIGQKISNTNSFDNCPTITNVIQG